jgi:hypothetical protein
VAASDARPVLDWGIRRSRQCTDAGEECCRRVSGGELQPLHVSPEFGPALLHGLQRGQAAGGERRFAGPTPEIRALSASGRDREAWTRVADATPMSACRPCTYPRTWHRRSFTTCGSGKQPPATRPSEAKLRSYVHETQAGERHQVPDGVTTRSRRVQRDGLPPLHVSADLAPPHLHHLRQRQAAASDAPFGGQTPELRA